MLETLSVSYKTYELRLASAVHFESALTGAVHLCRQMEWMSPLWQVPVGSLLMMSPMIGPAPSAWTVWPQPIWPW